jgi:hypothetical protein
MATHSPSSQAFPIFSQLKKHIPQWSKSSSVLTQTPSQISSPRPEQSPPVVICVVPVSVSPVVPLVWPVDDESLSDEVDVLSDVEVDVSSELAVDVPSELEVDVPSELDVLSELDVDGDVDVPSEVVGSEVIPEVIPTVVIVDMPLVLDIESVPVSGSPVVPAAVRSPGSSPQANRARPTSVASTTDADPWTRPTDVEQKGQRLSLSQT